MANVSPITEQVVTGNEIVPILDNIEQAIEGFPTGHVLIALVSIALLMQENNLTAENLQSGVKETTRFMCMFLDNIAMNDLPEKEKLKLIN